MLQRYEELFNLPNFRAANAKKNLFSLLSREKIRQRSNFCTVFFVVSKTFCTFPDFGDESPSITTLLRQRKYAAPSAPSAPERFSTSTTQIIYIQHII